MIRLISNLQKKLRERNLLENSLEYTYIDRKINELTNTSSQLIRVSAVYVLFRIIAVYVTIF